MHGLSPSLFLIILIIPLRENGWTSAKNKKNDAIGSMEYIGIINVVISFCVFFFFYPL